MLSIKIDVVTTTKKRKQSIIRMIQYKRGRKKIDKSAINNKKLKNYS